MHHYGEDAVSARVSETEFRIDLRNHDTDSVIMVSGPTRGVFEDPERAVDYDTAMAIGREFAHVLREITGEQRMMAR